MSSFESNLVHRSDALRLAQADRLAQVFHLHLRSASPALANAFAAASAGQDAFAGIVIAAVVAVVDETETRDAVAAFDRLRQAGRATARQDAVLGHALLAALKDVLGSGFDADVRQAWTDGYIRLVETVMAGRSNRMDLVA